ncbi:MAG: ATP-binding cassette domain-containing protein [Candidatus Hodarchaeales archaeon]|jgi:ABC-type multidrug transport system ATPase subunit
MGRLRQLINSNKYSVILDNITFSYPQYESNKLTIFQELSLKIKKGEIIGVFGPSGSGKTSLLSIITGNQKVDEGFININGLTRTVYQLPLLNPYLTCTELLELELLNFKEKRDLKTVLNQLKISEFKNTLFGQLSSGQKQRVSLAVVVLSGASVILADEPFSRLDFATMSEVRSFFLEIVKQFNLTLILVSHNKNHFINFDRILEIRNKGLFKVLND